MKRCQAAALSSAMQEVLRAHHPVQQPSMDVRDNWTPEPDVSGGARVGGSCQEAAGQLPRTPADGRAVPRDTDTPQPSHRHQ